MDIKALQKKYQQLLIENNRLKEEIKRLNAQLGLVVGREESKNTGNAVSAYLPAPEPELFDQQVKTNPSTSAEAINKRSGSSCPCSGVETMCILAYDNRINKKLWDCCCL